MPEYGRVSVDANIIRKEMNDLFKFKDDKQLTLTSFIGMELDAKGVFTLYGCTETTTFCKEIPTINTVGEFDVVVEKEVFAKILSEKFKAKDRYFYEITVKNQVEVVRKKSENFYNEFLGEKIEKLDNGNRSTFEIVCDDIGDLRCGIFKNILYRKIGKIIGKKFEKVSFKSFEDIKLLKEESKISCPIVTNGNIFVTDNCYIHKYRTDLPFDFIYAKDAIRLLKKFPNNLFDAYLFKLDGKERVLLIDNAKKLTISIEKSGLETQDLTKLIKNFIQNAIGKQKASFTIKRIELEKSIDRVKLFTLDFDHNAYILESIGDKNIKQRSNNGHATEYLRAAVKGNFKILVDAKKLYSIVKHCKSEYIIVNIYSNMIEVVDDCKSYMVTTLERI